MEITIEKLKEWEKKFFKVPQNEMLMHAVCENGILKTAKKKDVKNKLTPLFRVRLKGGDVTNQRQSGRCWMFASLNTFRYQIMKKLNLKTFEISENYPLFFDKLEKCNYFLETIMNTFDEKQEDRLLSFLLSDPIQDGGQWDMFCNLVKKYGIVPKSAMEEVASSSNTKELDGILDTKLRQATVILRKLYEEGVNQEQIKAKKEELLEEIYQILVISLGLPPETFDFEYVDKDEVYHIDKNLTPQSFFEKYVGFDLDDFVSIINAPTQDKPYYDLYQVQYLGNVVEGKKVTYLNLPIERLKELVIAQLQDGYPVWFGCDVDKELDRKEGKMDVDNYDKEKLFGSFFQLSKEDALNTYESRMTHAMVFMGANLTSSNKADKYCVENSWGKEVGSEGFYIMSDEWFSKYVYQIVVFKKYLTKEEVDALEKEPHLLKPWDPMGALA